MYCSPASSQKLLQQTFWSAFKTGSNRAAYLFLLKHHEVKVLDAFLGIVLYPLAKRSLRDDFPDILVNKGLSTR